MPAGEPCWCPSDRNPPLSRVCIFRSMRNEKDLKGSKPVSVAFLVELMRLDVQTLSEKHAEERGRVPGLLASASRLA